MLAVQARGGRRRGMTSRRCGWPVWQSTLASEMSVENPFDQFHPAVTEWFDATFEAPSLPQVRGWPAIRSGRNTLIAAPTGSGKTLAAFLCCIDDLMRQGLDGGLADQTQVLYISPLKSLSNDIQKNLASRWRASAPCFNRQATSLLTSASWCALATRRHRSVKAWSANHPISWSPPPNRCSSC